MALHALANDVRHSAALRRGQVGPVTAIAVLVSAVIAVGGVGAAALGAAGDSAPWMGSEHSVSVLLVPDRT